MIRGKSLKATSYDIAEGLTYVNPLFLKPLTNDVIKELHEELNRAQTAMRSERVAHNDIPALRMRNMKMQRLNSAIAIIKNYAKERRIRLV